MLTSVTHRTVHSSPAVHPVSASLDGGGRPPLGKSRSEWSLSPSQALCGWLLTILALVGGLYLYRTQIRLDQIIRVVAEAQERGDLFTLDSHFRMVDNECLPILIPLANRPEYFSQVVAALNNATGLENAVIVFSQDGHDPVIYDLAMRQLKQPKVKLHLWHQRPWFGLPSLKDNEYATTDNVYSLLSFAFDVLKAPGAIILESDVVPSHDFYNFFHFTYSKILRKDIYQKQVFTINGFNMQSVRPDKYQQEKYFRFHADRFMVWGWSMGEFMWPLVKKNFATFHNWDHQMQRMREENNLVSLTPEVARTKHVGLKGVNFQIGEDDPIFKKWMAVFIPDAPVDFSSGNPYIESMEIKPEHA
jgi:hypothetical protein